MKCTIQENRIGHLHIWQGWNRKIEQVSKYNYKATRKDPYDKFHDGIDGEASVYLQTESDVENLKESLTEEQRDNLNNGYQINATIDPCYWPDK